MLFAYICTCRLLLTLVFYVQMGWFSEAVFHIGKDRNFVCLWRRHNCKSQVIDLSLSVLISWYMKSIIGFLINSNLQAIISTSLTINLQCVQKIYFAVFEEIYNNVVTHWSAVLISWNHPITCLISFTKKASNQRSILSVNGPCAAIDHPGILLLSENQGGWATRQMLLCNQKLMTS
jgi:hypothetical protein